MWSQVSQSLHESMARVISRIATLLPGILAFILAVLFFAAIAWVLAWLVRTLLNAIRIDERLARGTNAIAEWSPTYTPTILITRVVYWCIVLVGFLVGLEAFGHGGEPQCVGERDDRLHDRRDVALVGRAGQEASARHDTHGSQFMVCNWFYAAPRRMRFLRNSWQNQRPSAKPWLTIHCHRPDAMNRIATSLV